MAPTVSECGCYIGEGIKPEELPALRDVNIKEYVQYRLDDIPFTTARKINHTVCKWCNGILDVETNKELLADMDANRKYLLEQDKLYSSDRSMPITPMFGNEGAPWESIMGGYEAPKQSKQWHKGFINYLRQVTIGDNVKILAYLHEYEVYCNEADKLSVAIKQFVKPDDFFKLVSIS